MWIKIVVGVHSLDVIRRRGMVKEKCALFEVICDYWNVAFRRVNQ